MPKLSTFLNQSVYRDITKTTPPEKAKGKEPAKQPAQASSSSAPPATEIPTTAAPLSGRATETKKKSISRFKKFSKAMGERPLTVGAIIMGFGNTKGTELGKTSGLPPAAQKKNQTVEGLTSEAKALTKRLNKIIDTSLEELPDTNKRPQRSLGMKVLTKVIPCFKPDNLGQLLADDPAYADKRANGKPRPAGATSPADTREQRQTSIDHIDNLVQATKNAEAALLAAQAGSGEIQSEDEIEQAGHNYHEAIDALRAALKTGTTVGANDNVLATEVLSHRIDFVAGQIKQMTDKLDDSGLDIKQRTVLLEQKREGLQDGVELARLNLHTVGTTLKEMHVALLTLESENLATTGKVFEREFHDLRLKMHANGGAPKPAASSSSTTSQQEIVEVDAVSTSEEPLVDNRESVSRQLASLAASLGLIKQDVNLCEEVLAQKSAELEDFLPEFTREINLLTGQNADIEAARADLLVAGQPLAKKAENWDARAKQTRELETAHHEQLILAMVAAPPGFSAAELASPSGRALMASLQQLAKDLPANDPQAERELPRIATLEIISRAIAGVTEGKTDQAANLLREVMSHPSEHWLPMPGTDILADARPSDLTHAAPSPALRQLIHRMTDVHRGLEVLNQVSLRDDRAPMGRQQSEALQTFWMADKAQVRESSPEVKAWLESAKFVAQHEVRNRKKEPPVFDTKSLPLEKLIAFRAVSKGIMSNGPGSEFADINRKLLKLNGQWVDAAEDKRHKLLQGLPRKVDPSQGKTPFHTHAIKMASNSMEAQGMSTLKTKASDSVAEIAEELLARVAGGCMTKRANHQNDLPSRAFDEAAKVFCEYVKNQGSSDTDAKSTKFSNAKHLYTAKLEKKDFEHILQEATKRLDLPAGDGKFPDPFFRDLFREKKQLPALEALHRVAEYINLTLAPWDLDKQGLVDINQQVGLDKIGAKIEQAEQKQFKSREDVVKFFEPMLENLKLRQQLTMTAGGEKGVGIPLLPWTPIRPWLASLNMNIYSKKDEATFQVKSPTFGVEFMVGETTTHAHDVKGTVGLGLRESLGIKGAKIKLNLTAPAVAAKVEKSSAEADLLVIRILRNKDDNGVREEQKARDDGVALLDTMLRWDATGKHPVSGKKFDSPIEAILALHPDVLLGRASKTSEGMAATAELSVAARVDLDIKRRSSLGGTLTTSVKVEKATEAMTERSGHPHQLVYDQSDQRKQRWGAGAGLSGAATLFRKVVQSNDNPRVAQGTPGNTTDEVRNKKGTWRVPGAVNFLDITRELAHNLEKNGATRFAMGDRTGGSLDRSYGSPKDLLAEIEANREDFFIRFLDTIPLAPDAERDTPENRTLAKSSLDQFIVDLTAVKNNPSLQFNIKYEMQPRMSGWVDALNALETIALQNGDEQGVLDTREAKGDLMSYRSTWAFKNCAIRNKGKETNGTGLDFIARWQSKQTVEISSAFTAYPA